MHEGSKNVNKLDALSVSLIINAEGACTRRDQMRARGVVVDATNGKTLHIKDDSQFS